MELNGSLPHTLMMSFDVKLCTFFDGWMTFSLVQHIKMPPVQTNSHCVSL